MQFRYSSLGQKALQSSGIGQLSNESGPALRADELLQVAGQFELEGQPVKVRSLGSGHLHKTYLLATQSHTHQQQYVLQEFNTRVFPSPAAVMENIQRVTQHIHRKLDMHNCSDISRRVLSLVGTRDKNWYLANYLNRCWRMYHYIDNSYTVDVPQDTGQIFEGAKAFGEFLRNVADLPGRPLNETLRDFHKGTARLAQLEQAADKNEFHRNELAHEEIEWIGSNSRIFEQTEQLIQNGTLPRRITHNDTKINNVLLDTQTHRAICVIDLDTVMPGAAAYDFGDLVRTAAGDTAEEEQDLSRIGIRIPRFEAIAKGYLQGAGDLLTDAEKESLLPGAKVITLIMATRFLTDFLEGDWYYATHRPQHNLHRCRAQSALFKSICGMEDQMRKILFSS